MKKLRELFGAQRRNGMSMVNVIVAFAVLLIIITAFTQTVLLSQNLVAKGDKLRAEMADLTEKYLRGDDELTTTVLAPDDTEFVFTDGKTAFSFKSSLNSYSLGGARLYSFSRETGD